MPFEWDTFELELRDLYVSKDRTSAFFDAELPLLRRALLKVFSELEHTYEPSRPLGRGGAGVVIKITDKRLGIDRALKVPRPKQEELIDSVRNESDHLIKLHHDHLIQLFTIGSVDVDGLSHPYPYFVMECLPGIQEFDEAVRTQLDTVKSSSDLHRVTDWLAATITSVASAIQFLHRNNTIHFDIKPGNLLIMPDGKAVLSDLGFAKSISDSADPVVVGFTLFYAHPSLRAHYQHMSSFNRVRRMMAPRDFKVEWDIYAFGQTLLDVLSLINNRFPDVVLYDYTFVYLHLLACRMLDGRNTPRDETERIQQEQRKRGSEVRGYYETWLNLRAEDFTQLKHNSIDEIVHDLKKLQSENALISAIPELASFGSPNDRVQVSNGTPAPFTRRVRAIVEHPVFARLSAVPQLGFASTIYPGATHTRLEHSLGTFRTCTMYVQALYADPYNPLFRQLIDEEGIKTVLLASLLHDLGQYPLAHELEEGAKESGAPNWKEHIQHERLGLRWLDNPTHDVEGRTIREVIENTEWGWGLPLDVVRTALRPTDDLFGYQDLREVLLRSILDGPIDVDKLDYLVRDSEHAYLAYGKLIDVERLVKSLTVIITHDAGDRNIFTLGTYEKGQSAAESVTFARYLLYQALYWHHTARAVRAMLKEAAKPCLLKAKVKSKGVDFYRDLEDRLGLQDEPNPIGIKQILDLIEAHSDATGRGLISLIRTRRYYKRILTIHSYHEEGGDTQFLDRFRAAQQKPEFAQRLQEAIRVAFETYRDKLEGPQPSVLGPEKTDRVLEMLSAPGTVIADTPQPTTGSTAKLRFIPEPKRLLQNYASRVEVSERVSEVWQQVYFKLMNIASKGRVFCHPDCRDTLMAALGPAGIRRAVERVVRDMS